MNRSLIRRTVAVALVAFALTAMSCKSGDTPPASPTRATPRPSGGPIVPVTPKGTYLYAAYQMRAELTPDEGEDTWTLTVKNSTGRGVGAPSVYALDALDGHRINAKIEGSEPLADGKEEEVTVTWEEPFVPENIGLVILMLGDDNFGDFDYGRE